MNPHEITVLARERRRALRADFARGDVLGFGLRASIARVLRAAGEALFRCGVALEERVPAAPAAHIRN